MQKSLRISTLLVTFVMMGCGDDDQVVSSQKSRMTDQQLEQILHQRYDGDRTGVCVVAAYIEADSVARATVCADPAQHRLDVDNVSLEIGSVTKTMTAALLASLINEGKLNLDDPLSMYLPSQIQVPTFQGEPILLKHLVTHSSGLPREPSNLDPINPYSLITEEDLLNELSATTLRFSPGTQWEYSNFAFMILSYVIANEASVDFEALLRERIFTPLGMQSYIHQVPANITEASGHKASNKQPAASLDFFTTNLAGNGGVRATLNDMVLYCQAQFGYGDSETVKILKMTHDQIDLGMNYPLDPPPMAWGITSATQGNFLVHGGDTIGFSSVVVVDPEHQRAVVVLEDTRLELGRYEVLNHLIDPTIALPAPRLEATPPESLLQALQGNYSLIDGVEVSVSYSGSSLIATFADGTIIELAYDSRGDFYPLTDEFGLLTPIINDAGQQTFIWADAENQFVAQPL